MHLIVFCIERELSLHFPVSWFVFNLIDPIRKIRLLPDWVDFQIDLVQICIHVLQVELVLAFHAGMHEQRGQVGLHHILNEALVHSVLVERLSALNAITFIDLLDFGATCDQSNQ